jgi:hypothetical protein
VSYEAWPASAEPAECTGEKTISTNATVLMKSHSGGLARSNFLLFDQEVTPLASIAPFQAPHRPVGEIEEHGKARSARGLYAPHCVVRFRCHTARPFIASGKRRVNELATSAASCDDTGVGTPCAALACSFIAIAAWVRQLPFSLLNSRVVTKCLQSAQLNRAKPFIILMV